MDEDGPIIEGPFDKDGNLIETKRGRRPRTPRAKKAWDPKSMTKGEVVEAILLAAYGIHWRQHAPERLGIKAPYLAKVIAGEMRVGKKLEDALAEFCRLQVRRIQEETMERTEMLMEAWDLIRGGLLYDADFTAFD